MRVEEIAYEAGRDALADQEALVAGVRQRTGTLLAAHALVASFLGASIDVDRHRGRTRGSFARTAAPTAEEVGPSVSFSAASTGGDRRSSRG